MKNRTNSKKMIIGAIVGSIVLIAIGIFSYKKAKGPSINYVEAKVERGNLSVSILSTGLVQPENRLEIKPPTAGRAESVLVNEGDKVKKGQVLAWMSSTERAALMDAASSKGPEEVARWEDLYKATPVIAPIDGMLILRKIESGQTFTASDAILVISDRLTVKAQVDETDISRVHLNQKVSLVMDAYPNEKIPAVVDHIAFEAQQVNNVTTYLADVLPIKTPGFMRSGMTANVTFELDAKQNVLLVPAEAVKINDGKSVVQVRSPENSEPMDKVIRTGGTDGKKVEVLEGLNEGDIVLIPEFKLEGKKTGGSLFGPKPRSRGK